MSMCWAFSPMKLCVRQVKKRNTLVENTTTHYDLSASSLRLPCSRHRAHNGLEFQRMKITQTQKKCSRWALMTLAPLAVSCASHTPCPTLTTNCSATWKCLRSFCSLMGAVWLISNIKVNCLWLLQNSRKRHLRKKSAKFWQSSKSRRESWKRKQFKWLKTKWVSLRFSY